MGKNYQMKITKTYLRNLVREEQNRLAEEEASATAPAGAPATAGAKRSSKVKDVEAAQQRTGTQVDKKMASVTADADIVPLAASQAVKVLKNSKNPLALVPKIVAAIKSQLGAK
jgi:hypothetical protein